MSKHKHVMVAESDGNRFWFVCELCPARVEVVPIARRCPDGVKITASMRVRNNGWAHFSLDELVSLARLWHVIFRSFFDAHDTRRPGRERRRRGVAPKSAVKAAA